MYRIVDIKDKIRVGPEKFELGERQAIFYSLKDIYEGRAFKDIGLVLAIKSINNIGDGTIISGDGAIYYDVEFSCLCYIPEQNEIVKGTVIDITEFGVFLRIGAIDGMIHVSQLMDDFVNFDEKNSMFIGKKSKQKIKIGDTVIARIISVSLIGNEYKIGLTLKQHGLGNIEWLREKKGEKSEKKTESM